MFQLLHIEKSDYLVGLFDLFMLRNELEAM